MADADRVATRGAELVRGAEAGGAPGVKVAAHIPGPAVDPADGPFTVDPALEARPAGMSATACLAWTRPGWPRRPACTR